MLVFFGRMIRVRVLPFLTHCCVARSTLKLLNGESQSWKGSRHYHSSLCGGGGGGGGGVLHRGGGVRSTTGPPEAPGLHVASAEASPRPFINHWGDAHTHTHKNTLKQKRISDIFRLSSARPPGLRADVTQTAGRRQAGWALCRPQTVEQQVATRSWDTHKHTQHTHTTLGFQNRILTVTDGRFIDSDLCSPILTCS